MVFDEIEITLLLHKQNPAKQVGFVKTLKSIHRIFIVSTCLTDFVYQLSRFPPP